MEKKTRLLFFLAAGVIVVISCVLIVAALMSYKRVENMSRQMKEQIQMTETMQEDPLLPEQYPVLPEAEEGASAQSSAAP